MSQAWSVMGDWNPTPLKVANHLLGPKHGLRSLGPTSPLGREDMLKIHDTLHDANPTSKDIKRSLEQAGYEPVRQTGSHLVMRRGTQTVVVPMHGELQKGLVGKLRRQSGVQLNPEYAVHFDGLETETVASTARAAIPLARKKAIAELRAEAQDKHREMLAELREGIASVKKQPLYISVRRPIGASPTNQLLYRLLPSEWDKVEYANNPRTTMKTFKQAQSDLLDYLQAHGWRVKRDLKVPHATLQRTRLWFHPQSIYISHDDRGQSFVPGLSLWVDPRTITGTELVAAAERDYQRNPTSVNPAGLFLGIAVTATLAAIAYAVLSPPRTAEAATKAPAPACPVVNGRIPVKSLADGSCPAGTEKGELESPPGSCVCLPIVNSGGFKNLLKPKGANFLVTNTRGLR